MNQLATINTFLLPASTAACHQQHQHWHHIIGQQEEEIGQLRALLLELTEPYICRRLGHDALDYCRELTLLQTKLDRLHRDLICPGVRCSPTAHRSNCADSRFGLSATIEHHAAVLADEYARLKVNCLQYLSGMMSLNLL